VELSTLSQTQSEVWKEFRGVEGGWKNNQGLDQTVPMGMSISMVSDAVEANHCAMCP